MINLNLRPLKRKKIILFASGSGSNARCIIDHFADSQKNVDVALVVSNNQEAGVLNMAEDRGIKTKLITRGELGSIEFLEELNSQAPGLIILAGFLLKIPALFIKKFNGRIINIHPALLPKYGGKGMYGMNVHKAVKEAHEKVSGCTIHWVNENYDEGAIIAQHLCQLTENEGPEEIARKVLSLEHEHYSKNIEKLLSI